MSTTIRAAAMLALCWLAVGSAVAHHGGEVEWADDAVGPITGKATKFAFQFPHVFFEMEVAEEGGVAVWTIATRWTPTILRSHGWSRDSIKPGDQVTVTYLPHVEKTRVGSMVTVEINGRPLPLSF